MKKFTVFAFCSPPVSMKNYIDYKECGFNTVLIDHSYARLGTKEYNKVYEICDELGLDAIPMSRFPDLGCQRFPLDGDPVDYNQYKSFRGVHLQDEPLRHEWPELVERIKYFNEKYPGKEVWLNTTPCYGEMALAEQYPLTADGHGHARVEETMRLYGEELLDTIEGNKIFSMDYYPLQKRGEKPIILHDWLWGVETCAHVAKEKNYDYYAYVQSGGWVLEGLDPYLAPTTAEELRFQILVYLAYGVVGYGYFTYVTPLMESFYGAIIEHGEKTPLYDCAKKVNAELKKFEPLVKDLDYVGTALWIGEKPADFARTTLYRMKHLHTDYKKLRLRENLYDVVIGEFNKEDRYGYVIANYIHPLEKKINKLKFEVYGDVEEVIVYRRGKKSVHKVVDHMVELRIPSGDGVFLTFPEK